MIGKVNGKNWASEIKSLLDQYGFSYVWESPESVNLHVFPVLFKQRVLDVFLQSHNNIIDNASTLILYKSFKTTYGYEKYLDVLPIRLRITLSQLRLASHKLRIETGRYGQNRTERHQRLCTICNRQDIEDEYHLIMICEKYQTLRLKYIKPYYYRNPSVYKFIELMSSNNTTVLKALSNYVYEALALRKTHI